jgi:hypothetical protein
MKKIIIISVSLGSLVGCQKPKSHVHRKELKRYDVITTLTCDKTHVMDAKICEVKATSHSLHSCQTP